MNKLSVLFDAYWWQKGPPSGAMVLKEMVKAWSAKYPNDQITLAVPKPHRQAIATESPELQVVATRLRVHPLINALELPVISRRQNIDAIITQNFTSLSRNGTVFVHDAIFKTNPEWFTLKERLYLSPMLPMTRFSKKILTSTLTEKARIQKFIPAGREVEITGLGIPSSLSGESIPPVAPDLTPGAFILSVGRLNIRKNLITTIRGALESGSVSTANPLVIVGARSGKEPVLDEAVREAVSLGKIILLGHVHDQNLKWLYANCSLFCYLSLDEGYGLPPVEAVSLGAKALVSDIPVFREVLGEAASYVDPMSVEKIAEAIRLELGMKNHSETLAITSWRTVVDRIRSGITMNLGLE